jgi:hypothetical protein
MTPGTPPQQQQQQQQQLTSLLQQRDILLANEPDTSRKGDKWLDWKRAVEEVEAHIAAEGGDMWGDER